MKEGSINAVLSIPFLLLLLLQLPYLSHFLPQQNNKKSTHKKLRKPKTEALPVLSNPKYTHQSSENPKLKDSPILTNPETPTNSSINPKIPKQQSQALKAVAIL
jgi:hypothetical protein